MTDSWLDRVKWNTEGLLPVVAQDATTGRVRMLAWMNRAALAETVNTGEAVYWSRARGKLWRKGEESGHAQKVRELRLDCDGDALLIRVDQIGGITCHTGRETCFFQQLEDGRWVDADPVLKNPEEIYRK
jgi:phosphoribosyl-AMP cyclohydrolase